MVGKLHFYDLFAPDVREQLRDAAFHAFAQLRRFQAFPNANISKAGEIVYLETTGLPILDEPGVCWAIAVPIATLPKDVRWRWKPSFSARNWHCSRALPR
jgi:hypothetical protein